MSSEFSRVTEMAEAMLQRGRLSDAQVTLERCIENESDNPRARLLLCRVLFQQGRYKRALDVIRPLESMMGVKGIVEKLERLLADRENHPDPAFLTESMGELLRRQGYLREALLVYLRLFHAAPAETRFLRQILLLRGLLASRGSDKLEKRLTGAELSFLDRWIKKRGG